MTHSKEEAVKILIVTHVSPQEAGHQSSPELGCKSENGVWGKSYYEETEAPLSFPHKPTSAWPLLCGGAWGRKRTSRSHSPTESGPARQLWPPHDLHFRHKHREGRAQPR